MTTLRRAPGVTDLLVALGVGVLTVGALVATPVLLAPGEQPVGGGPAWWLTGAVLVLQAAVLCWAAVAPRAVLALVATAPVVLGALAPTGIGNLADAAVLVAVLRAALLRPAESLRVVLPVAAALVATGQALDVVGSGQVDLVAGIGAGVLQAVAIVGVPAAGVLAVAARREARAARSGELAAMDREREALVRAAVAGERTAMARELHDIAAHHVSGIALMTAALDRQIDADPEGAKRAVRQMRAQSRALLDDLRRLVGLLREDAADPETIETLATVPALVASATAAGQAVELHASGEDAGVGPLAQLVAYRMVQESLANAAVHAPGAACRVDLEGGADRFTVVVRNGAGATAGEGSSGGFGLLGMRERADLVGGELTAGTDGDGGWTVRLELPVGAAVGAAAR